MTLEEFTKIADKASSDCVIEDAARRKAKESKAIFREACIAYPYLRKRYYNCGIGLKEI